MDFMYRQALRDLDRATPSYFKQEMFAHADLGAFEDAKEIVGALGDEDGEVRVLIEWLKVVPRDRVE